MDPPLSQYVVNHVFLPFRLPEGSDLTEGEYSEEYDLAHWVYSVATEYLALIPSEESAVKSRWHSLVAMLQRLVELNQPGPFIADVMVDCLLGLKDGETLAFLIRQQNTGIILRLAGEKVVVEAFQVSLPNADVLACHGKILRNFPDACISLDARFLREADFSAQLASVLAQLNMDEMEESAMYSSKAGSTLVETREPSSSHLVTDWLLTTLTVINGHEQPSPAPIQKRIADDVLWDDEYLPWRRSALWLVIRVALQSSIEPREYKNFMLFFVTTLMKHATSGDFADEILATMRTKVGKRAVKLSNSYGVRPFVLELVNSTQVQAENKIAASSSRFRALADSNRTQTTWNPSLLNFERDSRLRLTNSMPYIVTTLRDFENQGARELAPVHRPRHRPRLNEHADLGQMFIQIKAQRLFVEDDDILFNLATFEASVSYSLDSWTNKHLSSQESPQLLSEVISHYQSFSKYYKGDPESMSTMVLTIIELWISLDKITIHQIPLLSQYCPEMPPRLLEPLLLRKSQQVRRAMMAAQYLYQREQGSSLSIFAPPSPKAFSTQYFDQCRPMITQKNAIEAKASDRVVATQREIRTKNAEYKDLKARASAEQHQHTQRYINNRVVSDTRGCPSCRLHGRVSFHMMYVSSSITLVKASSLKISVYERPLPKSAILAKNFIFECLIPEQFAYWRSATFTILRDYFLPPSDIPSSQIYSYATHHAKSIGIKCATKTPRLTLASSTKSFIQTHYERKRCPTQESQVIVASGLSWHLRDASKEEAVSLETLRKADTAFLCTLNLPSDSLYESLDFSLRRSAHTVNEVLAKQARCPPNLGLHEFIDFGSLRSGAGLQWLNLAGAVSSWSLSFNRNSVYILVRQLIQQFGVVNPTGFLESHVILSSQFFCERLLGSLERYHRDIQRNWQEVTSLRCLVDIALRLLAQQKHLQSRTLTFIRACRATLYGWLSNRLRQSSASYDIDSKEAQNQRLKDLALAHHQTYDVDQEDLSHLLCSSQDVSEFLHCLIVLHTTSRSQSGKLAHAEAASVAREKRILSSIEASLRALILEHPSGLSDALREILPEFYSQSYPQASSMPSPNERWFRVGSGGDNPGPIVDVNILSGELLVDGRSLGILPDSFVSHSTYQQLFGKHVFQVVPSNRPDMDYRTQHPSHGGAFFYFRLAYDRLLVRMSASNSESGSYPEIFEYIPRNIFKRDLPAALVDRHYFWLDFSRKQIECRPPGAEWTASRRNWRILLRERGPTIMEQPLPHPNVLHRLVEPESLTFKMMYQQVASLDTKENILIAYRPFVDGGLISLHLPRYHLTFFHSQSSGSLESQDFPGTVIDLNRNIGTLYGLRSKLCLRKKVSQVASSQIRSIIIPRGTLMFSRDSSTGYPLIDVQPSPLDHTVSYHVYHIDTELGYLASADSSLVAHLYKAYLHAITSHIHPDELTGQTGLEEAIAELSSSACMSFQRLDHSEKALLSSIRRLSTKREYYPPRSKKMQKVEWNNDLPSFVQIAFFEHRIFQILSYDSQLAVFETIGDAKAPPSAVEYPGSLDLLTRSGDRELPFPTENILAGNSLQPTDVSWNLPRRASKKGSLFCEAISTVWQLSPQKLPSHQFTLRKQIIDMASTPTQVLLELDVPLDTLSYERDWFSLSEEKFQERWFNLVSGCCLDVPSESKRFRLLFSLSAWLYTQNDVASSYIPELLLIAKDSDVYRPLIQILSTKTSDLSLGGAVPSREQILHLVHSWARINDRSSRDRLLDWDSSISQALLDQWDSFPEVPIQAPPYVGEHLASSLVQEADRLFTSCYRAGHFFSVLEHFHESCNNMPTIEQNSSSSGPPASPLSLDAETIRLPSYTSLSIFSVFRNSHPPTLPSYYIPDEPTNSSIPIRGTWNPASRQGLVDIISRLSRETGALPDRYAKDIASSLHNLDEQLETNIAHHPLPPDEKTARQEIYRCLGIVKESWDCVYNTLKTSPALSDGLRVGAGQRPRIHLRNAFRMMTTPFWPQLSAEWKTLLIELCFRILLLQHARRVFNLVKRNRPDDLMKEIQFGRPSISRAVALEHPVWMLIQIESNFAARPVQLRMAQEMFEPTSGQNLALQLNMGEGKTSVIVPFVAAALADGRKLTRVIVLKPLVQQTFHLLRTRLCGLPNKPIAFFPFSRNMLRTSENDLRSISLLFQKAANDCAVVVAQPEHVLSSKLLTIERLLFSTKEASLQAVALHDYLKQSARDILDENDELLHVRYQLIYTLGTQSPIEGHPYRWTILQELLGTALAFLRRAENGYLTLRPNDSWIFPHFHVNGPISSLTSNLTKIVTHCLMTNSFGSFNLAHLSEKSRMLICNFVLEPNPSEDAISVFQAQTLISQGSILTLRGYLSSNILGYGLCERRWRVDYGLDSSRETQMAVPFRSKDVPSPRAEFGHPDLAILLTCLAYYYQGLTEEQLRHCFNRLVAMSDSVDQYNEWTALIPPEIIPSSIQQISGINLEDSDQFSSEVFPFFRFNFVTINFYVNGFVFPKYAKSFPHKLSTSGWDLAEQRNHPITGFSGTKDNHYLLPLSMHQLDPVGQAGTNALVLMYMLGPDNNRYFSLGHDSLGGKGIIDTVVRQRDNTHVILDVGAQILDLSNRETAQYWLEHPEGMTRVEAAVYFNDNDELSVIRRDGTEELFRSSTYREQTWKCVFYLDDAHTRGTDLKFPAAWRAAVTLGKKVTKDRLIQGCMRMRQLGAGQSLMFLASPDIDFAIRQIGSKSENDSIGVQDIILWAMHETCKDIEHHAPAWAQQGQDYMNRRKALDGLPASPVSRDESVSVVRSAWLQREAKNLRELYLPGSPSHSSMSSSSAPVQDDVIQKHLQSLGLGAALPARDLHEEQEREVAHEVEAEPEVERPNHTSPTRPELHDDLVHFVQTGILKPASAAFCTIDAYLKQHFRKRWGKLANTSAFSDNLLTTRDYLRTLEGTKQPSAPTHDFMKPVSWVLSCCQKTQLVVISPHEANELLPHLRRSKVVQMHQYIPAVKARKSPSQQLWFYTIPQNGGIPTIGVGLLAQLNVFAGELYPRSYADYVSVCEFLGVDPQQGLAAQSDGFVLPQDRHGRLSLCPFQSSPLDFFKEFFSLRRKGQLFDKSPIGKLLNGRVLTKQDFEC